MRLSLYLLLAILLSNLSYGQEAKDTIPRSLVRQINWMEQQNFPASEYRWNEPSINKHLQQALAYHKPIAGYTAGGAVLAGTGAILSTGGLIGLLFTRFVNKAFGWDEVLSRHGVLSGVGLVTLGGGAVMLAQGGKRKRQARQEIQRANDLYQSNYFDKGSKRK